MVGAGSLAQMERAPRRSLPAKLAAAALAAVAVVAAACGGDDPALSEQAARGRQIALAKGCAGCHGADGQGGVGPKWVGLAGSDVHLYDGSVVVADDDYLVRSIKEPGADLLADYAVQMPRNELSDAEIADVVAYIKELGTTADGGSAEAQD